MSKDKRTHQRRRRDAQRDENGKTIYEKVINGEIEPVGCQKGWKNLRPIPFNQRSEEEQKEIHRKGALAVQEIRGKKKTAKEVLENLLSLKATEDMIANAELSDDLVERLHKGAKDATIYDVLGAVAIGRALDGNVRAMEFIRDTRGDAPIKEIKIDENITTDADRQLMQEIAKRLEDKEIVVVKDITEDGK